MGSSIWHTLLQWAVSLILGAVFLASGSKKWTNPYGFVKVIQSYRLVGEWAAMALSPLLIAAEMFVAPVLLLHATRWIGALTVLLLQVLFIGAQIVRLGERLPFGCGCFFLHAPGRVTFQSLGINVLLLVMALYLLNTTSLELAL